MRKIVIVDDNQDDQERFVDYLSSAYPRKNIFCYLTGRDAIDQLDITTTSCILLDLRLEDENGIDILHQLQKIAPACPVILVTGQGDETAAVEALSAGAANYLPKDQLSRPRLTIAVTQAIDSAAMKAQIASQQETIDRANRLDAVGQFSAGIAHDFNNLLAVMSSGVALLRKNASPDRSATILEHLDQSIAMGTSLTTQLLSFSGDGALLATTSRLTDAFEGIKVLIRAAVVSAISVEFLIEDETLTVHCDQKQLQNALLNLVLNARDAARDSRDTLHIRISAAPAPHHPNNVEISVTDDGIGMTPEVLEKCTNPFFTTKPGRSGSGLGLPMVLAFVQKSGGHLSIESEVDLGTVMRLNLPSGELSQANKPSSRATSAHPTSGFRILLVEDNFLLLTMMEIELSDLGYEVLATTSASEALQYIDAGQDFDLLLTDVIMPEMGGYELASLIREKRANIPIIYLTGYSDDADLVECPVPGTRLQKPIKAALLVAYIERVVQSRVRTSVT